MEISSQTLYHKYVKLLELGTGFWWQWVGCNMGGFLFSLLLIEIGERGEINALEGMLGGAVIGLAQSFALRKKFKGREWWVLVNIASWGLVAFTGIGAIGWMAPKTQIIPLRMVYGIVNGTFVGGAIGVAQWLLLKHQIPQAWRWILAMSMAWAIGLAIGWTFGGVLRAATGLFVAEVIGLTVAWGLVGAITGIALIILLRDAVFGKW
ncbi:hypothetical protein NG798_11675 [Ancylothrix sp. C2]|uniref:hypothetical protein n=1 Tax=Ancylothrix sp. D3o TaxID=2953691 RepID=UPI0021BB37AB|nr:hypothetical protein [Ancylothrix sp. D3o]MCT7950451.1 hypothetical protein [Ancylothrix sp. D3o]